MRYLVEPWTVAASEWMALDSCQLTSWMNWDPKLSCSPVEKNLHDVVVVASLRSWGMPALIDEVLNFAWQSENEFFLPSRCQPLWQRHARFLDQYGVLRHWGHFCLSYA